MLFLRFALPSYYVWYNNTKYKMYIDANQGHRTFRAEIYIKIYFSVYLFKGNKYVEIGSLVK